MMSSWADSAIEELKAGKTVAIRPRGNSMSPKIESGAEVILSPIADPAFLEIGDIVLVSMGTKVYLHLISAADKNRVQIANNHGHVNGWVGRKSVYGRVIYINNTPDAK